MIGIRKNSPIPARLIPFPFLQTPNLSPVRQVHPAEHVRDGAGKIPGNSQGDRDERREGVVHREGFERPGRGVENVGIHRGEALQG